MNSLNTNKLLLIATSLLCAILLAACSSNKSSKSTHSTGTLDLAPETAAFVQAYAMQTTPRAVNDIPLQVSVRVGPASEADTVCQTGALQGPFEVTGNTVTGGKTTTSSQPILRHINSGDISLCLIITSPVDATLNVNADSVAIGTDTCDEPAADISGFWYGDYSCTNSCDPNGFDGFVELTITQDGYGATYTDYEANYEGTVCGNTFKFSGEGPGYVESGTFVLNADGSGSKTSSWSDTMDSCHGTCSDPNLQHF
jgi:major membrane immunogen (membrane-anchored lipoprotein)